MWPEWLRSPTSSPSRVHPGSKSFSCSSFKDIQAILKEPEAEPRHPKSPSVFHRVRISSSVLRSWAHKNSIPSSAHPSFRPPHQGIIIYFTSLRVVRRTYEDCRTVRSILRGFRVPIDERDLSMDSKFLDELQGIIGCNGKNLTLPKVFIGGRCIGGAEEIKRLNESGDLKHLISKLQLVGPTFCDRCGGIRFVLCEECNGSHKIYMEKCGFRTCNSCNINGLIMCPSCCPVLR